MAGYTMEKKKGRVFCMRVIKDIIYSGDQGLDLYLPDSGPFSIFIYFHGGGIEKGDKAGSFHYAPPLVENQIALCSVNYRMYPSAKYPEYIDDCAAAVAWVYEHIKEYGECKQVFVGGSSAGGYLSMMLCFDHQFLAKYGVDADQIDGFVHDAGQPTCHFNELKYRGLDSRRLIVDERAPLYHIGTRESYPPMLFLVSDDDMENRLEQTLLVMSTMKHFRYDESKYELKILHGKHCRHCKQPAPGVPSYFSLLVVDFIKKWTAQ